jgi:branched-chain amino acid transport system permease protein
MPIFNLGLLIDGLLVGSIFALAAYGLALVWGVMNVKNLAQGDFIMIGGYITWTLGRMGIDPLLGVPIAMVVLWGIGWVLYRTVISKVITRDLFTSLLATFGIAIVIQQGLNLAFGPDTQSAHANLPTLSFAGGLITIAATRIVGFVLAILLAIAVILFMRKSRMGQAIRATAQDSRAARVLGIDTEKIYSFTFCLNAAICGAAGALVAMVWNVQPFLGTTYSIRLFVIVTAAGFGNLPGVIAAGFGMGVFEQFGGFVLGAEFQQALIVLLLLAVLAVRQLQQLRVRQAVQ